MERDKLIKICEQVSKDAENDAKYFDSKDFNGKNVATYYGYHGAAIKFTCESFKRNFKR